MRTGLELLEGGAVTVKGKEYKMLKGSRAQVMNGTAHETTGGLKKKDLMMNKWGRILSLPRSTKPLRRRSVWRRLASMLRRVNSVT